MKCALTSSRLPSSTTMSTVHSSCTVTSRSSGTHCCARLLHVPGHGTPDSGAGLGLASSRGLGASPRPRL